MKALFLLCYLFVSLSVTPLSAQIIDRSLGIGFLVEPHIVRAMGGDKWLAVGRGQPYQGALGRDTLFAVIFDQQTNVLLKKTLFTSLAEAHTVEDALSLGAGTFLIAHSSGDCDAGGYRGVVQKYDSTGQVLWTLEGTVEDGSKPPMRWQMAPDGNILGYDYGKIRKVDAATGALIWIANLLNPLGETLPYTFDLVPGTEDFAGVTSGEIQIWKKTVVANQETYVLDKLLNTGGFLQVLGFSPNGWYYVLNRVDDNIKRYDQDLNIEAVQEPATLGVLTQMLATNDGIYWLGRHNSQNWLRKTDFLGQNPVEIPMPEKWLKGYSVAVQGDAIAVVGVDGSGPKSIMENDYDRFQTQHLWLRTFNDLTSTPSTDTINASVTDLQQLSAVDTTIYSGSFGSHSFVVEGGNFQVQITNQGNTIVERVYVNFSYEQYRDDICFSTYAIQKLYTDLQLAPGESTWVSFGDLPARIQSGLANEFCFWTSAPNNQPDAHHDDDFYCKPATYTVPTNAPFTEQTQMFPNPANDYFLVLNAPVAENEWRLYDATGRLMQQDMYQTGQAGITVSTQQLPDGFYFFQIGNQVGKLVVKH